MKAHEGGCFKIDSLQPTVVCTGAGSYGRTLLDGEGEMAAFKLQPWQVSILPCLFVRKRRASCICESRCLPGIERGAD